MAGLRWLRAGDFLSVWAYANDDVPFTLQANSAGFHAYLISEEDSTVAFSATRVISPKLLNFQWKYVIKCGFFT